MQPLCHGLLAESLPFNLNQLWKHIHGQAHKHLPTELSFPAVTRRPGNHSHARDTDNDTARVVETAESRDPGVTFSRYRREVDNWRRLLMGRLPHLDAAAAPSCNYKSGPGTGFSISARLPASEKCRRFRLRKASTQPAPLPATPTPGLDLARFVRASTRSRLFVQEADIPTGVRFARRAVGGNPGFCGRIREVDLRSWVWLCFRPLLQKKEKENTLT